MKKRRRAREMAVQMLYQSDLGGSGWAEIFGSFDPAGYTAASERPRRARISVAAERSREVEEALGYAKDLVRGTLEHREEIDRLIRGQAEHWRLERMPAVDRNILRLAVYELLYETDVPKLVVLDEAIELAKKFGSENTGRFVNGVLDGLLKSHPFPGSLT